MRVGGGFFVLRDPEALVVVKDGTRILLVVRWSRLSLLLRPGEHNLVVMPRDPREGDQIATTARQPVPKTNPAGSTRAAVVENDVHVAGGLAVRVAHLMPYELAELIVGVVLEHSIPPLR